MSAELGYILALIIGIFLGVVFSKIAFMRTSHGNLLIDQASDPNKENYIFEITKPLETIPKKRAITLRIKVIRSKNSSFNEGIEPSLKGEDDGRRQSKDVT